MFLLFAGDHYYPRGGWADFKGQFPTLLDAVSAANKDDPDWWQVVEPDGAGGWQVRRRWSNRDE